MKTAQDYPDAANVTVSAMDAATAIAKNANNEGTFIDVRDGSEIKGASTIKGAHRLPRGMVEFAADPSMDDLHNPVFQNDIEIYLICGAGGRRRFRERH